MDRLLYVDFQTGNWCEAPIPPKTLLPNYKVVSPVFPATRGETFQFTLRVFNIPSDPSSWAKQPLHLALRAKQKGRPNSNLLLYTNRQYSGSVSVNRDEDTGTWYFDLPASIVVSSQGINDLLKVSGPSGASVMEVPLDFEIRIYSDSASGEIDRLITSPSTLHVYNDLKRDNDSPDAPAMQGYPEPDLVFTKDQAEAWLDEYFRTHPIGVKSIGGETGDILLGTNLSMNGKTINATGGEGAVKSVNGQTGEVVLGLSLGQAGTAGQLSIAPNSNSGIELRGSKYVNSTTIEFTRINNTTNNFTLGTNLSLSGPTINGTGVSSIGGRTGSISLGTGLQMSVTGLLDTTFGPLQYFEEYQSGTTYGIRLKGEIGAAATDITYGTDEFGIGLRYLNSNVAIYPRTNEAAERYLAYYPDTSLEHELRFQDVALYSELPNFTVTALGGKRGEILLGTNLSMAGNTLNAAGGEVPSNIITTDNIAQNAVTSFNGSKGVVTYTSPVTSVNGRTGAVTVTEFPSNGITQANIGTYAVTAFGGAKGNILTGTNISVTGQTVNVASPDLSNYATLNGNNNFTGTNTFGGLSTFNGKLVANANIENTTGIYFTPTNTPILIGAVTSTADGTQHAWVNILNANGPRMKGTMINETGSPFDTWLYTGQLAVAGTLSMGGNPIVQVRAGTNATDAVNLSQLPTVPTGIITESNISTHAVTSFGTQTGDILLGTNLSMSGKTVNASGGEVPTNIITTDNIAQNAVTSFNGSKGAVTYTAPVTSVNGKTGAVTVTEFPSNGITQSNIGTYAVTSFGEKVGDIIVGENLVMQGQTINATGGSGVAGVSSIGGMDGDIILSSDLTATSASKTIGLNKSTVAMQNQVNTFTQPQTFSDAVQFTNSGTATVQLVSLNSSGDLIFKVGSTEGIRMTSAGILRAGKGAVVDTSLTVFGTSTVSGVATFNGKLVANADIENNTGIYYTPTGTSVQWGDVTPVADGATHFWIIAPNSSSAALTGRQINATGSPISTYFYLGDGNQPVLIGGNHLNMNGHQIKGAAAGTSGTDAVIVNQLPDWTNFATLQGNNNFVGTNTFSARTTFNSGITNTNGIYFTPTSTPVQIGAVTLTADGSQHYWLYHSNNTSSVNLSARRILETGSPSNTSLYLAETTGSVVMGGANLNMNSKGIVNLSPGAYANDAVNFSQLPDTSNFVTLDGTQTISGNKTFTGAVSISNATATTLSVVGTATFNGRATFNSGVTNTNGLYFTPTATPVQIGAVTTVADSTMHNWLSYRNEASSAGSLEAYQFLAEKVGANLYLGNAGNVTIAANSLNLNNKKIANLASGTATTDAVNVSQLPTVPSGIITTGNIAQSAVTSINGTRGAFTTGTGLSLSGGVLRTNLVNYPDSLSIFDNYNGGDHLFYATQGQAAQVNLGNSRTAVTGWMKYIDFRTGDGNAIRIYVGNSENNSGYGGFRVDLQGTGSETAINSDGFKYNGKQVLTQ